MGNCVSSTTGVEHRGETKPASLIGSVDHLGSGNEDNVTVSSYGNQSLSMQNNANSLILHHQLSGGNEISLEDLNRTEERRGSATPSLARSEEADCAVVAGYAEPHAFRLLRRQNDQSSIEALGKALRDDPNIRDTNLRVEGAPSRRPTALGVPGMQ